MDASERDQILREMQKVMNQRQQERAQIQKMLTFFSQALFDAFQNAVTLAQQAGIRAFGTPRRLQHPAGQGLSILQLFIEDWSLMLVPLIGAARPAIKDEAQIPPVRFKELSGRIAAFISEDPNTPSFYDFLIFTDGSWFAWGYGWPRQSSTLEGTDFDALAMELLLSFGRDIYTVWSTRAETLLRQAADKTRPAYEYRVLRTDE